MERTHRSLLTRAFACGLPAAVVLLLCFPPSLQPDTGQRTWGDLLQSLGILIVASLVLAWRLRGMKAAASRAATRKFFLCYLFGCILLIPLMAQINLPFRSARTAVGGLVDPQKGFAADLAVIIRQFPQAFEQHLRDQLRLPDWFVQFNALIKVYAFGVSPNSNIALGTNGFYFEGIGASRVEQDIVENFDNIADYMGQAPCSEDELLQRKMALEQRSYWLQQQGSEYVFVLAPTKAFVYPEYLPASLRKVRGQTRYEQLGRYLRQHADIHFVDLLPPLLEAKARNASPLLFYKTDFHWNFFGAFIAYKAMVAEMSRFFPRYDFRSPELTDFEVNIDNRWAHKRFLFMLGLPVALHRNEQYITLKPRPGGLYDGAQDLPVEGITDIYPEKKKITAADGSSTEARLLLNPQAPIPSIALLGDSFLEKCIYFFSANAQRVINYRTVINFPKELFHYEQPTIVIQEILNMFILRPPPKNPGRLSVSYFKEKFNRNSDKVLLHQLFGANDGLEGGMKIGAEPQTIPLRGRLAAQRPGEIRVGAMTLQAKTKGKLTLTFLAQDKSKTGTRRCDLTPGTSTCIIDLPPGDLDTLLLDLPAGQIPEVALQAFEVRSDAR